MSSIVRTKIGTAASGAALTITYDESTALSNAYGHVLILESHTTTAATDPLPSSVITTLEGNGWYPVPLSSAVSTNGNNVVRIDHFRQRGNGTVNSVTIPATTSVIRRGVLHALDAITENDFAHTATTSTSSSNSLTSRSVTIPAAAVGGVVTLVGVGLTGSAGGTSGFTWNRGTAGFGGTSSSSGFSSRYEVVDPPAATTYTATWTTTGSVSAMSGVTYGGAAGAPTIVHTDYVEVTVLDFRASASTSGGTLTHSISPTTGVTEPEEGLFIVDMTSEVQYVTVTSTDSIGGVEPVVTNITVPALDNGGSGLEELILVDGVLI